MKITLKNFRCYKNAEFNISNNDEGLILLSSPSGSGKSTLLEAIAYVLFGSKVVTKPYSYGTKSCKVSLEFLGCCITRSSTPNTLTVSAEGDSNIIDQEAQEYIEKLIGMSYENFHISSYARQGMHTSILLASPTAQLDIIEKIAFLASQNSQYHISLKTVIKQQLSQRKEDEIEYKTKVSLFETQYEEKKQNFEENYQERPEEYQNISSEDLQENVMQLEERINNYQIMLDKYRNLYNIHKEKEEKYVVIKNKKLQLNTEIKQIELLKSNIQLQETNEHDMEQLDELDKKKAEYYLYHRYIEDKKKIKDLEQQYFSEIKQKRAENEVDDNDMDECHREKKRLSKLLLLYNEKTTIWNEINDIFDLYPQQKDIKTLLEFLKECVSKNYQELTYKCPSCNDKICLHPDDGFVKTSRKVSKQCPSTIISNFQQMQKWIILIERYMKLKKLAPSKHKPEDYELQIQNQEKLYASLSIKKEKWEVYNKILENKELPTSIISLKENLKPVNPPDCDISAIETEYESLEEKINMYRSNKNLYISYEKEILKKKNELKLLNIDATKYSFTSNLHCAIQYLQDEIHSDTQILNSISKQISNIQVYEIIDSQKEELDKFENQIAETKNQLNAIRNSIENLILIDRLYKHAETLSIENTLTCINEYANIYLEEMFEDPIIVKLENIRTLKKGDKKIQMNTHICYKGHVYDKITSLSGGEIQRVNLAFFLAINDLLGGKLILLDECTNNLDVETSLSIFTFLKKLHKDKLIITVSHEAISGVFDNVLSLE